MNTMAPRKYLLLGYLISLPTNSKYSKSELMAYQSELVNFLTETVGRPTYEDNIRSR